MSELCPVSCPSSYHPRSDGQAALPWSQAAQRFALAIERSHAGSATAMAELRDAAREYVWELRTQSFPAERALIYVKGVISRVLRGRQRQHHENDDTQEHLRQQVITWCIEAYYRAD